LKKKINRQKARIAKKIEDDKIKANKVFIILKKKGNIRHDKIKTSKATRILKKKDNIHKARIVKKTKDNRIKTSKATRILKKKDNIHYYKITKKIQDNIIKTKKPVFILKKKGNIRHGKIHVKKKIYKNKYVNIFNKKKKLVNLFYYFHKEHNTNNKNFANKYHIDIKFLENLDKNFNLFSNSLNINNTYFFNNIFYFISFYSSNPYIRTILFQTKDFMLSLPSPKTYSLLCLDSYKRKKYYVDKVLKSKFIQTVKKCTSKKKKKKIYTIKKYNYVEYYIDRHNPKLDTLFYYYLYKFPDLFANNYHLIEFNFCYEDYFAIPEYRCYNLFNNFNSNILITKPFDYLKQFNMELLSPFSSIFIFKKTLSIFNFSFKNFLYSFFFLFIFLF
jgi:hypothetical protein